MPFLAVLADAARRRSAQRPTLLRWATTLAWWRRRDYPSTATYDCPAHSGPSVRCEAHASYRGQAQGLVNAGQHGDVVVTHSTQQVDGSRPDLTDDHG